MKISITAKTDIGKERDQNEDAFTFCPNLTQPEWRKSEASIELGSYGCLLAVADGMGGANAGEVASAMAMETVRRKFSDTATLGNAIASSKQIIQFLQTTIEEADYNIRQYGIDHPEAFGLGTTIVLCWLLNQEAYIAWCGDSRCYIYNHRKGLHQLTKDHSYVQELVDQGKLTENEAFTHPDSNIITRVLGDVDEKAIPDITMHKVHTGDMLLLCSDGLCGYCTNSDIERTILESYPNANKCCDRLLQLALDTGGFDNICIMIASILQTSEYGFFRRFLSKQ